jgi:hypothetical protein
LTDLFENWWPLETDKGNNLQFKNLRKNPRWRPQAGSEQAGSEQAGSDLGLLKI